MPKRMVVDVASKAQRNRASKRKNRRTVVPIDASNVDELPRPLRLFVEGAESFKKYLAGASTAGEAAANARAAVRESAQQIAQLAEPTTCSMSSRPSESRR